MSKPNVKVSVAVVAGAVCTVVAYALTFFNVDVPPEVAAAFTTVLAALLGYFTKEAEEN